MKSWLAIAAVNGVIAVAAGAFAAHGLKTRLSAGDLAIFETAARYQMYHALALLAVAWLAERAPGRTVATAGWAFTLGIAIFSGSLYLLALTGRPWLGAVTPVGGLAFLIGWLALLLVAWRANKS